VERAGIVFGWSKIKWARILGLNWSGQGWNILFVLDSNRRRVWVTSLEYLDGAEVKWTRKMGLNKGAGIFGRSSMEMESNGLIFGCN
jgi:hypothetical protein